MDTEQRLHDAGALVGKVHSLEDLILEAEANATAEVSAQLQRERRAWAAERAAEHERRRRIAEVGHKRGRRVHVVVVGSVVVEGAQATCVAF